MIIMAIDPGREGGFASLDLDTGRYITVMPLPYNDDMVDVDVMQRYIIGDRPDEIWLEEQQARNKQAHQAIIMQNYGRLTAVADLCGVPWKEIRPQTWQVAIHGRPNSDKGETIAYLQGIGFYPPKRTERSRKPDSGMADAMAISLTVAAKGWFGGESR